MKKKLLIGTVAFGLLLTGCGKEAEENASKGVKQTTTAANSEKQKNAVDTNSEENTKYDFSNKTGDFKMIGLYSNETSDKESFMTDVNFNSFKISIVPALVEVKLSEDAKMDEKYGGRDKVKAIMLKMDAENTLEDDVDYNGNLTLVTDTGEQLSGDNGVGSANTVVQTYHGKVKQEGYDLIPLKGNEIPKSFKLIMGAPDKLTDGAFTGEGTMGDEQRIQFDTYTKYTGQ